MIAPAAWLGGNARRGDRYIRKEAVMPHLTTRRLNNIFGKKVMRYFMYKKAKKLCSMINRDMAFFEARFLRARAHA